MCLRGSFIFPAMACENQFLSKSSIKEFIISVDTEIEKKKNLVISERV
jgi:hypothetical protein